MLPLVHEDLPVVGEHDARAFKRPRRRALEVDAREPETAAVARALELALGRQVVRRAAEVRARADQNVEAAYMLRDVIRCPDDPDAVLILEPLVDAHAVFGRQADLELLRRLVED